MCKVVDDETNELRDATPMEAAAIRALQERVSACPKIIGYDGWKGCLTRIYVVYKGEMPPSPLQVQMDPDLQPFYQEMLTCLGPCRLSTPRVYYSSKPEEGYWVIVVCRERDYRELQLWPKEVYDG